MRSWINGLRISTRLSVGFSVIIFLTLLMGMVAVVELNVLAGMNQKMYDHPFTVSNAVREIQANINGMHRSMKDVPLSKNKNELNDAILVVEKYERKTFELFNLAFEKFLGDQKDVQKAYKSFSDWRSIREEVIQKVQSGALSEAAAITKGKGAAHVEKMNVDVQIMIDYASNKAAEFNATAQETKIRLQLLVLILLVIIILIGGLVSMFITRTITVPIKSLTGFASDMALGINHPCPLKQQGDEIGELIESFNNIISSNNQFIRQVQAISNGDFSKDIQLRSRDDELGLVFTEMTQALRNASEKNNRKDLLKTGQNQLNNAMRGDHNLKDLSQRILTFLANFLDAQIGALYVYDSDADELKLEGSFAFEKQIETSLKFKMKEGLVGQTAYEKQAVIMNDVPENYLNISSGIYDSAPKSLLIYPILLMKSVKAVIELGSVKTFTDADIEFMDLVSESIGIVLSVTEKH